ncbi:hypothetical protein [Paenibacillus wynnii]|uniref:hypothetical protein n=1 Tax=Paenibacillus wynnii TaxID=268407 RepID=UPI002792B9DB|nr:hypothetical protein [Paenibacillus wynnii]MDQ0192777.1 hypothetical protein [Paenibacillus wynnii]
MLKVIFIFSLLVATASPIALDSVSQTKFEQVKKSTDFKLLLPRDYTQKWKLEIKEPYPVDATSPITRVRLHYFDKSGQTYMFGIEQHKAFGYKIKTEKTVLDVRNKTSTTVIGEEEFKFDTHGETVIFKGIEARFVPWANHIPGGFLRWVQDGTYIEIDSNQLSKTEMIEVAISMN